jgi:alpha-tubulin suppressor-like RCC1 family protein
VRPARALILLALTSSAVAAGVACGASSGDGDEQDAGADDGARGFFDSTASGDATGNVDANGDDAARDGSGDASADAPSDAPFVFDGGALSAPRTIAAGGAHACAIVNGGQVRCWGDNSMGQLGGGTEGGLSGPVDVVGITTAIELAAGHDHTCALLTGGSVKCWGGNEHWCLGTGSDAATSVVPIDIVGLSNVVALSTREYHVCAIRADRHVLCWGAGGGNFGNGMSASKVPVEPEGGIDDVLGVGTGWGHTCVARGNGSTQCWGEYNVWGQLGDGPQLNRYRPVTVVGLAGALDVKLGFYHSCARVADGAVECWGNNQAGQMGLGYSDQDAHVPAHVPNLPAVRQLAPGGFNSCVVTVGNDAYCWAPPVGATTSNATAPTLVTSLAGNVAELAGGDEFVCARLLTGAVACWGQNSQRQLGADAGTSSATPVVVQGL